MKLTIHAISDTHNRHLNLKLPGGDILIHAGDATLKGLHSEIVPFLDWYADQDYSSLIFVPGNHDFLFEKDPELVSKMCSERGIILLNDSGTDLEGIKVWGSPITPWFFDWAFNRHANEIKKHWDMIPNNTEILITHGPAHNVLDFIPKQNKSAGCPYLLEKIMASQIKLHVCGHIHEGRGYTYKHAKTWVNASVLDGRYRPIGNNPTEIIKDATGDYSIESES